MTDLGLDEVVLSCAGCYRMFKEEYPKHVKVPFKVKHISEHLAEQDLKLKPFEGSDHLSRPLPPGTAQRRLRGPQGRCCQDPRDRVEGDAPEPSTARCCGGGGGVRSAYPELSSKIAAKRVDEAQFADLLVTSLPVLRDQPQRGQGGDRVEGGDHRPGGAHRLVAGGVKWPECANLCDLRRGGLGMAEERDTGGVHRPEEALRPHHRFPGRPEPEDAEKLVKLVKAAGEDAFVCRKAKVPRVMVTCKPSFFDQVSVNEGELGALGRPLADAFRNFHSDYVQPLRLRKRELRFDRTLVMGILNVTPDSFSDGGLHRSVEEAVQHGWPWWTRAPTSSTSAASRPGRERQPTSIEQELSRVLPVIKGLAPSLEDPDLRRHQARRGGPPGDRARGGDRQRRLRAARMPE